MNQHDLEKSFVHTNPEPTTDPPLGIPRRTQHSRVCRDILIEQTIAEERERCAKELDKLAEQAKNMSEMWLRKDEVRRSEAFADRHYAYWFAAGWLRKGEKE